ncbi:RNA polymerase sigma factor [Butyricimonas sp.]|uniref:RNA polymerase sigma factor n=1 Tax=Butyricimonas sp. TaxID=1969738 RepID=UPI0025BA7A74|nr:RNA polymerase sigma-70 factor [Butyricimonas sp.]
MREIGDVNEYLVNGLRNQSHEVFEVIFKTYYPSLYRLAYAYLMNKNLAEDMVQDTFVSLWSAAPSLPADTRLKSYLYSSVKHGCLDYIKHLQVIDANKEKLAEALIFSGTVEYEDNQELLDKVKQCMQGLPEQQRKVLELKVFQKMNYKEIARELDITEESVHTYVKRAYKYLRESVPYKVLMILFC